MDKPNYYAIITAEVRYDETLSANEKLLFGEITALSNATGECWASNSYFSNLYNRDNRTIRRWISNLVDTGYINSSLIYKQGTKEVDKRILTVGAKVSVTPGQKCPSGEGKNVLYNNTRKNNIKLTEEFDEVWVLYGRKGNKQSALRYWLKLSDKDRTAIKAAIPSYLETRERKYRKDFSGWINPTNRMWEDELETDEVKPLEIG